MAATCMTAPQNIHAASDGVIDHARGDGAVWAAGLKPDQNSVTIRDAMIPRGVVCRAINTDTNAFCPPLMIADAQVDRIVDALADSMKALR